MNRRPAPLTRRSLAQPSILACVLTAACCALLSTSVFAEEAPEATGPYKKILVVDFEGEINTMTWAYTKRRIERAEAEGFDCLVLRIDSPGGTVYHSELIADRVFELDGVHTVAWVPRQALSGACMVAMGCDEIVMKTTGTLGDCQPIFIEQGGGGYQEAGEKMESPLRAIFRKYAEKHGYPIPLAEAFVSKNLRVIEIEATADGSRHFVYEDAYEAAKDGDVVIGTHLKQDLRRIGAPVVTEKQLLTVTAREAKRLGFIKREFPGSGFPADEEALLSQLRAPGAEVVLTEPSFFEQAGKVMLAVSGILAALVALAAMLTVFQGFGLISIIGGIALVLMLLINATADQLYGFPIFLLCVGVLLLLAEVFIIPGFGIAGILGIGTVGAGCLFLATGSGLGETQGRLNDGVILSFAMQFILSLIGGFILIMLMSKYLPRLGPSRKMMLATPDGATTVAESMRTTLPAVGAVGAATTALRPAGSAEFEGRIVDVISNGSFIEPGTRLRVVALEGALVTVAPVDDAGTRA